MTGPEIVWPEVIALAALGALVALIEGARRVLRRREAARAAADRLTDYRARDAARLTDTGSR